MEPKTNLILAFAKVNATPPLQVAFTPIKLQLLFHSSYALRGESKIAITPLVQINILGNPIYL